MTRYRTIVADPPWDHSDGTGITQARDENGRMSPDLGWQDDAKKPPYEAMSLDEIRQLRVSEIAEPDAHLYLWTTNRYLEPAYVICRAWGFDPVKPIVWAKAPMGPFLGGPYGGASVEFCLYARRGNLAHTGKAGRQHFDWPRGPHSAKPEAFIDLIEQVSPGPYVELFARRARLGWDVWGNESLGTAHLPGTEATAASTLEDAVLEPEQAERIRASVNGEWIDDVPEQVTIWDYRG